MILLTSFVAIVLGLANAPAFADDQHGKKHKLKHVKIRVVDKQEKPVANAEIVVWGLRTLKEGASGYGNRANTKATTDDNGIANVPYPQFVYEEMETGALIIKVVHDDFAEYEEQDYLISDPKDIKLERGRRIEIALRELGHSPVNTDDLFVMTPISTGAWKIENGTTLLSRPMASVTSPILVIGLPEVGPAWFSTFLNIKRLANGNFRIRGIELKRGRQVTGRLSDNVPRPIEKGVVQMVVSGTYDENASSDNTVMWYDTVLIEPDGSFQFQSAPRGFPVQFIAMCDGWVSESRPAQEILERFDYVDTLQHAQRMHDTIVMAQEHELKESEEAVVQMTESANIEFEITDNNDKPIHGAAISVSPNYCFFPGPGGIMGDFRRTRDRLRQDVDAKRTTTQIHSNFASTNANGYAIVRNMPRQAHGVSITHAKYELPPDPINRFSRGTNVDATDGTQKLELKMQPKGSVVLGR